MLSGSLDGRVTVEYKCGGLVKISGIFVTQAAFFHGMAPLPRKKHVGFIRDNSDEWH